MTGSVSSSFRHGIWMMSFMGRRARGTGSRRRPKYHRGQMSRLRQEGSALAVLGLILLGALALRLWNLDHGLPFAYNADEAEHFVPRALAIAGGGGLDPGYYENPPSLTYLLALVYWIGGTADAVLTARVVVALIGTLVVGLTFLAGRRAFDARSGLVAAAVMAVAFLPVFYSKHALNDVVTLAPVAVALIGALLVYERGRWVDYALCGGAVGVATATKYTAGAMLLTLAVAAGLRVLRDRGELRRALAGCALAGAAFLALFLILNPYALLNLAGGPPAAQGPVRPGGLGQAGAGRRPRLGLLRRHARLGPGLAAARRRGGRRDRRRTARLAPRGAAARVPRLPLPLHGRTGPLLRPLAAARLPGALRARGLRGRSRWPRRCAGRRSSRPSSPRCCARRACWRASTSTGSSGARTRARRRSTGCGPTCRRGSGSWSSRSSPPSGRRSTRSGRSQRPFQAYEKRLRVRDVDRYRAGGYCTVVVGSTQKERGLAAGLRSAERYYPALDDASAETVTFSPFADGADPVGFSYDFSFNYAPRAYERPGPVVEIHRLSDCP